MAILYRADGTTDEVKPANGTSFTLAELQTLVGGYIEIVRTHSGLFLVLDENGKVGEQVKFVNRAATMLYQYGEHDPIVGDAVVGTLLEIDGPPDEEDEDEEQSTVSITEEELTQLQYAVPVKGESFRLYIFGDDGLHSGGQWFRRMPVYPDEEITVHEAKTRAEDAITAGSEIRITDGGDMLVYHFKGGKQLYPAGAADVWEAL